MPFKSIAQQHYICATNKELCKRMAAKTPKSAYAKLPEHVAKKK